jgi:hypothetical protein
VPDGNGLLVIMVGASAEIVRLKTLFEKSPSLPVTRTVKLVFVAAVGVPLITPALFRFKPEGRLPAEFVHV